VIQVILAKSGQKPLKSPTKYTLNQPFISQSSNDL